MTKSCDLILLTWEYLKLTKPCIESILKHTHVPTRLIIVDNGSKNEDFMGYLRNLKGNDLISITVLFNKANEGYPKGMNIGMKQSSADYVCLLNNDILVTDGWLSEIIAVAESDESIGVVTPASNTFSKNPRTNETIDEYAKRIKSSYSRSIEIHSGEGFCMLIKRQLIERIGYLDETFGMGYFEEVDFCRRIQAIGYRCVMAERAYVWHIGGASWSDSTDAKRIFTKNAEVFYKKWDKPKRLVYIVSSRDTSYLQNLKKQTRQEANKASSVFVYFKKNIAKEIKLCDHFRIKVFILPDNFFILRCIWRVLKKRKKYDSIITNDKNSAEIFKKLKLIHKAEVIV